jgi:hypothetical protein
MFRIASSALFISAILSAAGCDRTPHEALFVSEVIAAPANAPAKGWQSSVSPTAVDDTVVDYE